MDPIPEWLTRLWHVWDVRVLVLLSLTLQLILSIFGKWRKNHSSWWIRAIGWSAYLMADLVAIVALGKLSDNSNTSLHSSGLRTMIWAPLLLLHLGGPDTITTYSVEDKNLWKRHFAGLSIRVVVAIYVVILSWRSPWIKKYSWIKSISCLALLAGMIKNGERIWVLKLVSNDKRQDIVPFQVANHSTTTNEEQSVSALILAIDLVEKFVRSMNRYDPNPLAFTMPSFYQDIDDDTCIWKVLEAEMGLMYDLLYTKATITYTEAGCILRSISFACTVCMLVQSIWLFTSMEVNWHEEVYSNSKVDIAVTGMLVAGALALEICALNLFLFSDWTMLWLIKHGGFHLVIKLGRKFPWLFSMFEKKRWSRRMGQFDLLRFCLKSYTPSMRCRRVGLQGIVNNFNWYKHRTYVTVPSDLPGMILSHLNVPDTMSVDITTQYNHIEVGYMKYLIREDFQLKILIGHIATELCYDLDVEASKREQGDNQIITCRTLSHYMTYLLFTCTSMLPIDVSDSDSDSESNIMLTLMTHLKSILKDKNVRDVRHACQIIKSAEIEPGQIVFRARCFFKELEGKEKKERWKILGSMWLSMICYTAINVDKNDHLHLLRQGGNLLTLVWFFVPQILHFGSCFFTPSSMAIEGNLIKQLILIFAEVDNAYDKYSIKSEKEETDSESESLAIV